MIELMEKAFLKSKIYYLNACNSKNTISIVFSHFFKLEELHILCKNAYKFFHKLLCLFMAKL